MGMMKIENETGSRTPVSAEDRAALLQKIMQESGEDGSAGSGEVVKTAPAKVPVQKAFIQPNALAIGQTYVYGDSDHQIQAKVYNVTLLPFYFWWYIDYNKFVAQQPDDGDQFLVVHLRFENTGTMSALVPSAELLPVVYGDTIYTHQPYFNTSVLSDYQRQQYGGVNEAAKLPYQWIRELGQDQRDYAYLTGYYAIDSVNTTSDSINEENNSANWSGSSYINSCTGSISVTTDSGKVITEDISDGQCPGFFIKPGPGNAVDGYLIYEVPEDLDLRHTYLYGFFNRYSWTRWRLG